MTLILVPKTLLKQFVSYMYAASKQAMDLEIFPDTWVILSNEWIEENQNLFINHS